MAGVAGMVLITSAVVALVNNATVLSFAIRGPNLSMVTARTITQRALAELMGRLADITVDYPQDALESVEEKTPAQRLLAGITYKIGISQPEIAEWFDVERKTMYNWLTQLEERV